MNVRAVESSTLRTTAYDESLALLRLEFRSRAVYDYFGVPAAVHEALLRAPSIGACFNERASALDAACRREGER